MVVAALAALLLIAPIAGCATGGQPSPGETTNGDDAGENDGGNDAPLPPDPDPAEDTVITAPINVPPFGGDEEFSPHTIARFLELVTERCGGELCVEVVFEATPDGFQPIDDEHCEITLIEPSGVVDQGSTITMGVDCFDSGGNGGETIENHEGETGEDGGEDGG